MSIEKIIDYFPSGKKIPGTDILLPCKRFSFVCNTDKFSGENIIEDIVSRMYKIKGNDSVLTAQTLMLDLDFVDFIVSKFKQNSMQENENLLKSESGSEEDKIGNSNFTLVSFFVEQSTNKNLILPFFFIEGTDLFMERYPLSFNKKLVSFATDSEFHHKVDAILLPFSAQDYYVPSVVQVTNKLKEYIRSLRFLLDKQKDGLDERLNHRIELFKKIRNCALKIKYDSENVYLHTRIQFSSSASLSPLVLDPFGRMEMHELSKTIYENYLNNPEGPFGFIRNLQNTYITSGCFGKITEDKNNFNDVSRRFRAAEELIEKYNDEISSTTDYMLRAENVRKIIEDLYSSLEYGFLKLHKTYDSGLALSLEDTDYSHCRKLLSIALKKIGINLNEEQKSIIKFSPYRLKNVESSPDLQTLLFITILDCNSEPAHPFRRLYNHLPDFWEFLKNLKFRRDSLMHGIEDDGGISKKDLVVLKDKVEEILNILLPGYIQKDLKSSKNESFNQEDYDNGCFIKASQASVDALGASLYNQLYPYQKEELASVLRLYFKAELLSKNQDNLQRTGADFIIQCYKFLESLFLDIDKSSQMKEVDALIFDAQMRNYFFSNSDKKNNVKANFDEYKNNSSCISKKSEEIVENDTGFDNQNLCDFSENCNINRKKHKKCIFDVPKSSSLRTSKIVGIQKCLCGKQMSLQAAFVAYLFRARDPDLILLKSYCQNGNVDLVKFIDDIVILRGHGEITSNIDLSRLTELVNSFMVTFKAIMLVYGNPMQS